MLNIQTRFKGLLVAAIVLLLSACAATPEDLKYEADLANYRAQYRALKDGDWNSLEQFKKKYARWDPLRLREDVEKRMDAISASDRQKFYAMVRERKVKEGSDGIWDYPERSQDVAKYSSKRRDQCDVLKGNAVAFKECKGQLEKQLAYLAIEHASGLYKEATCNEFAGKLDPEHPSDAAMVCRGFGFKESVPYGGCGYFSGIQARMCHVAY